MKALWVRSIIGVGIISCVATETPYADEQTVLNHTASALEEVRLDRQPQICEDPSDDGMPDILLLVNEGHCLGCLSVGQFIREQRRRQATVWLGTRQSAGRAVCDLLRRDNTLVTVVVIPDAVFPDTLVVPGPVLVTWGRNGAAVATAMMWP